jgi:hypothetical protein
MSPRHCDKFAFLSRCLRDICDIFAFLSLLSLRHGRDRVKPGITPTSPKCQTSITGHFVTAPENGLDLIANGCGKVLRCGIDVLFADLSEYGLYFGVKVRVRESSVFSRKNNFGDMETKTWRQFVSVSPRQG